MLLVMGKSIRIDSAIRIDICCRIVVKNFDSVPQLQRFSYVHHCAARSRHGSHSRQCRHSLLQRQLAALLQCGPAGHGFGGLVQQLQDQCPEPLVWTVEGGSDRATNLIESNRFIFCRIAHHYRRRSRLCSLLYPAWATVVGCVDGNGMVWPLVLWHRHSIVGAYLLPPNASLLARSPAVRRYIRDRRLLCRGVHCSFVGYIITAPERRHPSSPI